MIGTLPGLMESFSCIELTPKVDTRCTVIWLHGLGADGNDFVPIVHELRLPEELGVKFLFPHAPRRPVTLNGGMVMRAWFDLFGLDAAAPSDEAGIYQSCALLWQLIDQEVAAGVPAERIVLAGFSQGGVVALHTALRYPQRLAGVIALSTWLPLAAQLAEQRSGANAGLPIFLAHGDMDPLIPVSSAHSAHDALCAWQQPVQWFDYPMPHSVCAPEIDDIAEWLLRVLGSSST